MPAVVASRPQRTEQMFQALKRHITREREKKKQEQEADAEVERQRKEIEAQQKQNVMTLEENNEQIDRLVLKLAQLKDEKHQLFLQLKRVLNEDDNRRRQLVRQQESNQKLQEQQQRQQSQPPPPPPPPPPASSVAVVNPLNVEKSNEVMDVMSYGGLYPSVPQPIRTPMSHLLMQPNYPVPVSHTLLPPGSLKRTRSPSPTPQPSYSQSYVQKPPGNRVSYKTSTYANYYPSPGTTGVSTGAFTYSTPQFASPSNRVETAQDVPQTKHPVYISQPLSRPPMNQAYVHSALEHSKPYSEEKYYSLTPVRPTTHVPLHGGAIPIQQPAQGAKTGGITSGYPIRLSSSAPPPPPSHATTPTTPHFVNQQPPSGSRLVYSQAGWTPRRYIPREV